MWENADVNEAAITGNSAVARGGSGVRFSGSKGGVGFQRVGAEPPPSRSPEAYHSL